MKRIYFDNNATTPVAPEVLEAMLPCFQETFGNPSSVHRYGREAKVILDQARQQVAGLIGAEPNEIIFTSCGTESNNLALRGLIESSSQQRKHLITTEIEHHAILHPCRALQKMGVEVTTLKVDGKGQVDPEDVRQAIGPDTLLVSVMMANNEIGTLQPIREIGELARAHDIYFHTDAIQAVGKVPVDVHALGVDLLSLSGHKFHAPKGVGALYVRKGTPLRPLLMGGGHERNRRAGTENVPYIAGLGAAAKLARSMTSDGGQDIARLRDYFEQQVMEKIPGVSINGDPGHRLPNTSNLLFADVDSEAMVINLDLSGVACSTGSACTSGSIEPSHVLLALGLSTEEAFQSIRFSFSRYTTPEEVDDVLQLLPALVRRLRLMTPQGVAKY
ncbi:MAG: cysteine desulfurase NifS [Terriglobia bacterium]